MANSRIFLTESRLFGIIQVDKSIVLLVILINLRQQTYTARQYPVTILAFKKYKDRIFSTEHQSLSDDYLELRHRDMGGTQELVLVDLGSMRLVSVYNDWDPVRIFIADLSRLFTARVN